MINLLWIEGFEVLITHTIWYYSFKWYLHIVPLFLLLKVQHSFLP